MNRLLLFLFLVPLLLAGTAPVTITSFIADPHRQHIRMYWRDANKKRYGDFKALKKAVDAQKEQLLFAMNGGMYKEDHSPQGLFIDGGKIIVAADTNKGGGNFYMKPNGIFYIRDDGTAGVCETSGFRADHIAFATQSGPLLILDGKIHPAFHEGSANLNIRNGVGILPDGNVLFAISDREINFYDFAQFFAKAGCRNALYLDGYVSRAWEPSKSKVPPITDFGVMIAVSK